MAHKVIDRCKETTSTTGTGTLTLTGAVANFVAMADATAGLTVDGDTSWFCAENGAEWEVFLGTRVDATHLARTTVLASSNAGAAVSFTSAPTVFSTVPAERVASVGPCFRAYLSADQTLTSGTTVKVNFNTESFDVGACYDSTANYRWTPNVAGYYDVDYQVSEAGSTISAGSAAAYLFKNGTKITEGIYVAPTAANARVAGSDRVYMNGSTDYLEVFATISGTGTMKFVSGAVESRFSGHFIRGV